MWEQGENLFTICSILTLGILGNVTFQQKKSCHQLQVRSLLFKKTKIFAYGILLTK